VFSLRAFALERDLSGFGYERAERFLVDILFLTHGDVAHLGAVAFQPE
jgi:hypothetical protein